MENDVFFFTRNAGRNAKSFPQRTFRLEPPIVVMGLDGPQIGRHGTLTTVASVPVYFSWI